jgi:hypothetical protein
MYFVTEFAKINRGYKESILINFNKNESYKINNLIYTSIQDVFERKFFKNSYLNEDILNFLIEERIIHFADKHLKDNLIKIDSIFFSPYKIEYLVFKLKSLTNIDLFLKICQFYSIPFLTLITDLDLNDEVERKLTKYSFPFNVTIIIKKLFNKKDSLRVFYEKKQNDFVSRDTIFVNHQVYKESQKHHTYFNRKLYIGEKGEIKNAPECEEIFGYIQDIEDINEIKKIIEKPEFQKYWYVHKEICDVCKDCEFRHMCVDNRLPYKRKENEWYHKVECNYNPFICKWKGEEGYRTLAECGVISNENEYTIDHERIAKINEELWGEEE